MTLLMIALAALALWGAVATVVAVVRNGRGARQPQ